jgi:hypothetical protein
LHQAGSAELIDEPCSHLAPISAKAAKAANAIIFILNPHLVWNFEGNQIARCLLGWQQALTPLLN